MPNQILRCGLIAIFAVVTMVASSGGRQNPPPDAGYRASGQETPNEGSFTSQCKLLRMANGVTKDGFAISMNTYRAPDGDTIDFLTYHYDSADRAQREFDDQLKRATKVITQISRVEESGHTERLAVFVITHAGKADIAVLASTAGPLLHSAQSKSLQDVELFAAEIKVQIPSKGKP